EEVVMNIQGYMIRSELPPVLRKDRIPKNPVTAKQSVVITGLGGEQFEDCVRAIMAIHTQFAAQFPPDVLLPWAPQNEDGHVCLEFSNRYFSPISDPGAALEFDTSVDPQGILKNLDVAGKHTEDNKVLYYERVAKKTQTGFTYLPCRPTVLRVGHLVELQVSFSAIPIARGRYIMLRKLRSICDLNEAIIQETTGTRIPPVRAIKRTVGYDDDSDPESTQHAMKRLRVSGVSGVSDDEEL
ncbi:hypothetical protein BC629DRAFT_1288231, partial [Irpex lacteus]